jgi:hypothetical protein
MEYNLADSKCNTKFGPQQTETKRCYKQYSATLLEQLTCVYFQQDTALITRQTILTEQMRAKSPCQQLGSNYTNQRKHNLHQWKMCLNLVEHLFQQPLQNNKMSLPIKLKTNQ